MRKDRLSSIPSVLTEWKGTDIQKLLFISCSGAYNTRKRRFTTGGYKTTFNEGQKKPEILSLFPQKLRESAKSKQKKKKKQGTQQATAHRINTMYQDKENGQMGRSSAISPPKLHFANTWLRRMCPTENIPLQRKQAHKQRSNFTTRRYLPSAHTASRFPVLAQPVYQRIYLIRGHRLRSKPRDAKSKNTKDSATLLLSPTEKG